MEMVVALAASQDGTDTTYPARPVTRCRRADSCTSGAPLPCFPLAIPFGDAGDGANVPLRDGVVPSCGARQEEDGFLDVWGEVEEGHDLGDAGGGDVAEAGESGVVFDLAAADEAVELDGERHEAGDARHVARLDGLAATLRIVS